MYIQTCGVIAMNKCPNCKVNVYESEKKCPLCRHKFEKISHSNIEFPKYEDIIKNKTSMKNIPVFIAFVAIVVCCYINFFTYDDGDIVWSLIVAFSCLGSTFVFRIFHTNSLRLGSKIVLTYLSISAYLFSLDILTGVHLWSTNYAIPLFTMFATLFLTFLTVRSRQKFAEYFGNLLTICFLSFFPVAIYLLGFSNIAWGFLASGLFSCIIVVGIYLFSDKTLKKELRKRFHR